MQDRDVYFLIEPSIRLRQERPCVGGKEEPRPYHRERNPRFEDRTKSHLLEEVDISCPCCDSGCPSEERRINATRGKHHIPSSVCSTTATYGPAERRCYRQHPLG